MKTKIFNRFVVSFGLITSLFFLSCNKNDNDDTAIEGAGLMAVNLAPETSASFAVSGNIIVSSLPYNSYTVGYYSIFPGNRIVDAYNFAGIAASNSITFQSGKYYSLFLLDTGTALRQIIVEDGVDTLRTTTQSYIRYINAIQNSGSPIVTISSEGVAVVNESANFTSVSDFTTINAGSININVTNSGTLNVSRTITVEGGKIYTILLSGVTGESGDKAPQIKFIVNGTADGTDERTSGNAVVTSNN